MINQIVEIFATSVNFIRSYVVECVNWCFRGFTSGTIAANMELFKAGSLNTKLRLVSRVISYCSFLNEYLRVNRSRYCQHDLRREIVSFWFSIRVFKFRPRVMNLATIDWEFIRFWQHFLKNYGTASWDIFKVVFSRFEFRNFILSK